MSAAAAHCLDGNAQQGLPHLGKSDRVSLEKFMVDRVAPHQRGQHRAKQERISARTNREMQVGHFGGLGAARIDDDQLAAGSLRI